MQIYSFTKAKKEFIVGVGIILALVIPFLVKIFNFPDSVILSILAIYLSYIVLVIISTENRIQKEIMDVKSRIKGSGVEIIELDDLYKVKERCEENNGEIWFFNIPLEKTWSEDSFNVLLRCAVENPETTRVTVILNKSKKGVWEEFIKPKLSNKVNSGINVKWSDDIGSMGFMLFRGSKEALIFLWTEPFIIRTENDCQIMTLFWIKDHPEIILKLEEIFEKHLVMCQSDNIARISDEVANWAH